MASPGRDDNAEEGTERSRRSVPGAAAVGNVVRPFQRTGRYYTKSWRQYLGSQRGEVPAARPTIALAGQAFLDEIVLLGFRVFRPVSDAHAFKRINREVTAALELYEQRGCLSKH